MLKHLLHKLWNERHSNVWPILGIFITFILMWYAMDMIYVSGNSLLRSSGYEIDHVYKMDLAIEPNFDYGTRNLDSIGMINKVTIDRILRRFQEMDEVESACLLQGSKPYENNMFQGYVLEQDTMIVSAMVRYVSPEYFDVFRVKVPEEVKEKWDSSEGYRPAVVTKLFAEKLFGEEDPVGKTFEDFYAIKYGPKEIHDQCHFVVSHVIPGMRHQEFSPFEEFVILPIPSYYYASMPFFTFRVKPEADGPDFAKRFMKQYGKELSLEPFYVFNVEPYKEVKKNFNISSGHTMRTRSTLAVIIFFLFNLFVGIGGIFWFRTEGRKQEIGLEKALGATNAWVGKMTLLEAWTLLVVASIPAIVVCAILSYKDVIFTFNDLMPNSVGRFFITIGLTLLVFFLIIAAAVHFPARRAMKVQAIEALEEM